MNLQPPAAKTTNKSLRFPVPMCEFDKEAVALNYLSTQTAGHTKIAGMIEHIVINR